MAATKRILIVEDEKPLARALALKLGIIGFITDIAENGDSALTAASTQKYDLIILDLILPKRDGFDVLRELREKGDTTPVVVLSNLGQEEDIVRAMKLGALEYFVKANMQLAQLVERIKEILIHG